MNITGENAQDSSRAAIHIQFLPSAIKDCVLPLAAAISPFSFHVGGPRGEASAAGGIYYIFPSAEKGESSVRGAQFTEL